MQTRGVFAQILVRLLPVDLFVAVMMTTAWLAAIGVRELGPTLALAAIVCSAKILAWIGQLWRVTAPIRAWEAGARDDDALLAATYAIDDLPTHVAIRYCAGWVAYIGIVVALAWFVWPELLVLGRSELLGIGAQLVTAVLGPWMLAYPLVHRTVEPTRMQLVAQLEQRGVARRRGASSLVVVVTGMVAGLILAPACWLLAHLLIIEAEAGREQARRDAEHAARWAARELATGAREDLSEPERAAGLELVPGGELPPALARTRTADAQVLSFVDVRREQVSAAAAVGDGRWVVSSAPVGFGHERLWLGLLCFALAVFVWALLAIRTTNRSVVVPLALLRDRLRLATKVAAGPASLRLPVARSDEIGELFVAFNELLDELEDIARAADAVAGGDLRVELDGEDHLRVVFRGMVDRLSEMVAPVRAAASEVTAAAAALDATTREQDRASRQQAERITEVSQAMQRLADAIVAISGSAAEVLDNADQTHSRADLVVSLTAALSQSLDQIRGLLEQIHEVADRSDLLALNGSLEATRAGEAGRGFALVAAEMRRLAERTSQTVVGVRSTLADVDSSHAATADATRSSRELAEHTSAAARRIVDASRAQTDEARLVSGAVEGVAVIIEQSEHAAKETRVAADGLREQARRLEQLLERFEV
jgi:methyl-accepting chemotaxis protein